MNNYYHSLMCSLLFFQCYAVCGVAETKERDVLSHVRDNLYKDSKGNLFLKTSVLKTLAKRLEEGDIIGSEIDGNWVDSYRSYFSAPGLEDEEEKLVRLKEVIDEGSWLRLSAFYYRDKSHLYYHSSTCGASGGLLFIEKNIDPNMVRFFNDGKWISYKNITDSSDDKKSMLQVYMGDGKRIYCKGVELKGADVKTFKVIRVVENFSNGHFAIDENHIYNGCEKITIEEYQKIIEEHAKSDDKEKQDHARAMHDLIRDHKFQNKKQTPKPTNSKPHADFQENETQKP